VPPPPQSRLQPSDARADDTERAGVTGRAGQHEPGDGIPVTLRAGVLGGIRPGEEGAH